MFDDLDTLRASQELRRLLTHYAQLGVGDRTAWQDRLMSLEGVTPAELVRLHGELIAGDWIEQNTGITPVLKLGVIAGCYRITSTGVRALKQIERDRDADEEEWSAAA